LADCFEQSLRVLAIECLPGDLPDRITVDVSQLNIGDSIHVREHPIPLRGNAKGAARSHCVLRARASG